MKSFLNKFWLSEEEMENDLEELGYEVIDIEDDYIYVIDIDERINPYTPEMKLKLIRANNTITIVK